MSNEGCCHIVDGPRPISWRSYRQRLRKTKRKEFCQQKMAFAFLVLQPAGLPCRIWICQLPQSLEPIPWNLLDISFFCILIFLKNICIYTYTHTHTFYWLCLPTEPQLMQLCIQMIHSLEFFSQFPFQVKFGRLYNAFHQLSSKIWHWLKKNYL